MAAWDSSAATLLLHFLLPHHPFLTLLLPHKPHRTVQIRLYSSSTAIPFQPIPWTPQDLTVPAVTQCRVYKVEVMAQLIANMHCNCPKENDNKPKRNKHTKSRASSLTKYTYRLYASKSWNVIKTNPGGAKRITVTTLKTAQPKCMRFEHSTGRVSKEKY